MLMSTTANFDSSGPPPDTPVLTMASQTLDLITTSTLDTLNSMTSFKTATSKQCPSSLLIYFPKMNLSVLVNPSPTTSSTLGPTLINLPPTFKQSVQSAVQWWLRHYACKLDPHISGDVKLSILDAIDLALRILERSHGPQNMVPFVGIVVTNHSPVTTSISAHLCPTTLSSVLYNIANHAVQGSLKAICLSGKHLFTVLNPVAKSTLVPNTYEMVRLDVPICQAQRPLIPGKWDQDQDYN
ncbi:hypothetical protein EV401DRAFT_2068706 [Pisolithus croceorrhizus]|nr:hypothetical protein EV401DRAFT_2068706 [Pisolithus croceorrhizus]